MSAEEISAADWIDRRGHLSGLLKCRSRICTHTPVFDSVGTTLPEKETALR